MGIILWALAGQYFLVQPLVSSFWPHPYSWSKNYISDLGATACGTFNGRQVCSPAHGLMNASFLLLGACIAIGAIVLTRCEERKAGLIMIAFGGVGSILVGLFPETTVAYLHELGALLSFVVGSIGIVAFASGRLRGTAILLGILGLLGTALFVVGMYAGLGAGGMERIAAYPFPLWITVYGLDNLKNSRLGVSGAAEAR